jgi:ubiquinone/menaquinone biosynthesis C-methylase UbiE
MCSAMSELNPQAKQMADESMVRTLAAQVEAIWPQELPLFARYGLNGNKRILDAGCGTGEATARLAELYPTANTLGVDIVDAHLERGRATCARFGDRVRFENRSIFDLGLPSRTFDLVVCRHVIHAVPHVDRVLAEFVRLLRPGGFLHLIAEDYGMIQFPQRTLDPLALWPTVPAAYGPATGTDLFIGRRAASLVREAGLRDVRVDYVVVDTQRVPRETFAAIWQAWRDGYSEVIAEHTSLTAADARAHFDDQIATLRDPNSYAVWFVPVVSAQLPK